MNMDICFMETTNGYKIYREGFNGCSKFEILVDTLDNAMKILEMIMDKESSFNL